MSARRKTDVQIGNRYGRLTVRDIRRKPRNNGYFEAQALCQCECGKENWIAQNRLRNGARQECRSCTTKRAWCSILRLPQHELWLRKREKDYRVDAYRRGLEFSLSRKEFRALHQSTCVYCGIKPADGVDRRDNTLGYTSSNAASCCAQCNYGKRDQTVAEFLNWVRRVHVFRGWQK